MKLMTVRFKHPGSRKLTLMAAAPVSSSLVLPLMWLQQWEMLSPAWHKYLSHLKIPRCHFITKIPIYKTDFLLPRLKSDSWKKNNFYLSKGKIVSAFQNESRACKRILGPISTLIFRLHFIASLHINS